VLGTESLAELVVVIGEGKGVLKTRGFPNEDDPLEYAIKSSRGKKSVEFLDSGMDAETLEWINLLL
jgi:hypothetical protein